MTPLLANGISEDPLERPGDRLCGATSDPACPALEIHKIKADTDP
jgi:hypothetical protein